MAHFVANFVPMATMVNQR